MKAILCGECFDIKGLDRNGEWTTCACGNVSARWTDPQAGKVIVKAKNRNKARIIGMNNQMLRAAFAPLHELMVEYGDGTSFTWDQVHKQICKDSKGYIFHEDIRNCWACIVQVGETNDIRWENVDEHTGTVPPPTGSGDGKSDKEVQSQGGEGNNQVHDPNRQPPAPTNP